MPKLLPKKQKFNGEKLYRLRLEFGYTFSELSEKMNHEKTPSAIQKWESGHSQPGVRSIYLLSEVFHLPFNSFYVENEIKKVP